VPLDRTEGLDRIDRFDRTERGVHWATAALFGCELATGAMLYVPYLAIAVGHRAVVAQIHIVAGIALPVPLILGLVGRNGSELRTDLARVNRWSPDDRRWMASLGRDPLAKLGKFNPGQKLNTSFTGATIVVMVVTGLIMRWGGGLPAGWQTGATFVHDVFSAVIVVVVLGHLSFALSHPQAIRAIVRGWVSRPWAARHAPAWLTELDDRDQGDDPTHLG
jgi:formate dehydrogenase subunit gamma